MMMIVPNRAILLTKEPTFLECRTENRIFIIAETSQSIYRVWQAGNRLTHTRTCMAHRQLHLHNTTFKPASCHIHMAHTHIKAFRHTVIKIQMGSKLFIKFVLNCWITQHPFSILFFDLLLLGTICYRKHKL